MIIRPLLAVLLVIGGLGLVVAGGGNNPAAWSDSLRAIEAELLAIMPHFRIVAERLAALVGGLLALIAGGTLLRRP